MQLRNHKSLLFTISGLAAFWNSDFLFSQDIKKINCQYHNSSGSPRICLHFDTVFNLLYSKWNKQKILYAGVSFCIIIF